MDNGRYDYTAWECGLTCQLAKTMIIRRVHKKSFGSERTWDSIEYVDTPLSSAKFKEILGQIMPSMVRLAFEAIPQQIAAGPTPPLQSLPSPPTSATNAQPPIIPQVHAQYSTGSQTSTNNLEASARALR